MNLLPRPSPHRRRRLRVDFSCFAFRRHPKRAQRRGLSLSSVIRFRRSRGIRIPPGHRRNIHKYRGHPRNPKDRIQQRPILRPQTPHLRLQTPRIPSRRNPPPNLHHSHRSSVVPAKKSPPPFRGRRFHILRRIVGLSSGHGFIRAANAQKSIRLQPLRVHRRKQQKLPSGQGV